MHCFAFWRCFAFRRCGVQVLHCFAYRSCCAHAIALFVWRSCQCCVRASLMPMSSLCVSAPAAMGKQGTSRYRGVTRPGDGSLGWLAQKRGICYAARFTTEAKAATWLARRLGVSVSSLRQAAPPNVESEVKESFHGVVYHSGCWEARLRGGVVLGYFGSQDQALRKVMQRTGKSRKQLKRTGSP